VGMAIDGIGRVWLEGRSSLDENLLRMLHSVKSESRWIAMHHFPFFVLPDERTALRLYRMMGDD
jgi:hypothetical protein